MGKLRQSIGLLSWVDRFNTFRLIPQAVHCDNATVFLVTLLPVTVSVKAHVVTEYAFITALAVSAFWSLNRPLLELELAMLILDYYGRRSHFVSSNFLSLLSTTDLTLVLSATTNTLLLLSRVAFNPVDRITCFLWHCDLMATLQRSRLCVSVLRIVIASYTHRRNNSRQ